MMLFEEIKKEVIKALNDLEIDNITMYDFEDTVSIDISLKKPKSTPMTIPTSKEIKERIDEEIEKKKRKIKNESNNE